MNLMESCIASSVTPFVWNEFSTDCTRCLKLVSSRSIFALRSVVSCSEGASGDKVNGVVTDKGGGVAVSAAEVLTEVLVEVCVPVTTCGSEGVAMAEWVVMAGILGAGTADGCSVGSVVLMAADAR